jgi:hypothetical protein
MPHVFRRTLSDKHPYKQFVLYLMVSGLFRSEVNTGPYRQRCWANLIEKHNRKEKKPMKKPWSDVLVVVLVAATEAIVEILKHLKKKGKAAP